MPFALASAWAPDFVAGIRKAIEKGLPSETALRAATLGAAEALGLADSTGSLETGKLADVVVWSGEPFAKDTKARYVFVDGRLYEPEAEEKRDGGKAAGAATASSDAPKSETSDKADDKPLPPLPTSPSPFPAGKPVAITNATILSVGPAGTIEGGTLLIKRRQDRRRRQGRRGARRRGGDRRQGPLRDAGHHRHPLAHRDRRRRQRVHRRDHGRGAACAT